MKLSTEELVNRVVAEVMAELARRGKKLDSGSPPQHVPRPAPSPGPAGHVIDMSGFKSPVLLESHLQSLGPDVKEVVVPTGTVVTPGAREILKKKNLTLKSIPKTN